MAVDINAFIDLEAFEKTTGDILRDLRSSKKAPGQSRIYTAGEKEYIAWLERKDKGVPINEALQKDMTALKKDLGLSQFNFPFEG
jgi:LDH2 family malate/lactate/ureidoglycolate dehydrogenase